MLAEWLGLAVSLASILFSGPVGLDWGSYIPPELFLDPLLLHDGVDALLQFGQSVENSVFEFVSVL